MPEATTPIYIRHHHDHPEHIGSGVLIGVSDRCFMATAAHVVDGVESWDRLHIGVGTDLVPMLGDFIKSELPTLGRLADPFDVAVAEVDLALLGLPAARSIAPRLVRVEPRPFTNEICSLVGYPCSIQNSLIQDGQIEARTLTLNVVGKQAEGYTWKGLPVHVMFDYHADDILVDGFPAEATDLECCSGAGLWHWGESSRPQLIGIFTDHDKDQSQLRATRIWTVVLAIRILAPELAYHFT